MLQPIATPLQHTDPAANRIAGLVLRLEEDAAPTLTLTTLAVRHLGGAVQPYVVCHLADGSRHPYSPADARLAAHALRDAAGLVRQLEGWAEALEEAADTAERQAAAILLGEGEGRGVRGFGPPPVHPYWRDRYEAQQRER